MNFLLWVLQAAGAFLFGASGIMKIFMFDKVSKDVPSFGALPRKVWMALGVLELICTAGLVIPAALHQLAWLTVMAAAILAVESCLFVWVHIRYKEPGPIALSGLLGLLMAFVAYARFALKPIS